MTTFTRPTIDTPEAAADLIEQELATGCLNENVLAPGYPVEQALRVLIAAVRRTADAETRLWDYLGTETYICDRDASAWSHGTMGLDDFRLAREDDEFMQAIIEAVTANGPAAPNGDPRPLMPAFQDVMDAVSALTIRGN